jgi:RNA polymerase sigma-70 factor (ECF subfamily)
VTPTDGEVIARVLAGDVDAYGILVERYQGRFARFATRMLGNREDAEEALQDALLRAYRALGAYRDRERFASWFYRILVNRCRSRLAQSRRRAMEEPLADQDGATADAGFAGREQTAWLLSRLPVQQREVFLLHYVEDLSYEDIAAITGVGVSALKMRVKRGLEHLRQLLREGRDA